MPRYALQYHVHGKNDFNPAEAIDAETIEEACTVASARVSGTGAVSVSHDEEMIVIPVAQIQYVTVRAVVERRAARPAVREFDLDVIVPWNSDQEETAS